MPTSWDDLLKPQDKGLIVMPNPSSSGTDYLSVSAILQLKGEAEGWKYLGKLNDNMAVYTHSGSKPCKMAGAGETVIGISFDYRAIKQMADGQPIEAIFPQEGARTSTSTASTRRTTTMASSSTLARSATRHASASARSAASMRRTCRLC